MSFRSLVGGTAASVFALAAAYEAQAQVTSSAVRGVLSGEGGAPVAGAEVTITHVPTGTTETATTSNTGSFFESGLRVGGPFTVTISADGYEVEVIENIFLQPGPAETLNIDLVSLQATETIFVLGEPVERLELNRGVGSTFSVDEILRQPATTRDFTDVLARDPLVQTSGSGQLTIAGVNSRFNNLTIDGVQQTDDFGLSDSVFGTNRNPVSLDAIEALSVVAADYSVLNSAFQGGLVNVVTKSGQNEVFGSGYYFRTDEDFVGNATDGEFFDPGQFTEEEFGFTLGGPIIKDRAFFFVSYEEFESARPANFAAADASDQIFNSALFDEYSRIINESYGFDAGGRPDTLNVAETAERLLVKLDANITDDHRASFTYQSVEEDDTVVSNNSLSSAFYATPQDLDSYSFQLFSDWTNNLSTTFRVGYKTLERLQNCNAGTTVGQFELDAYDASALVSDFQATDADGNNIIQDPSLRAQFEAAEATANAAVAAGSEIGFDAELENAVAATILGQDQDFIAGCDRFRHANTFEDRRITVYGQADYNFQDPFFGYDNVFTAGFEVDRYDLENLFASDTLGRYRFNTLEELQNQTARVTLRAGAPGQTIDDLIADWGYTRLSLFFQNDTQLFSNFSFNYGVRYERFFQGDEPPQRDDFEAAFGRTNRDNLDGIDIFQPRIGFEYTPFNRTNITGGFGLFSGGNPQVWVSNAFQPQIFEEDQFGVQGVDPTGAPGNAPESVLNALAAVDPNTPAFIDTIDPNFEIPSLWKASLRLQQEFDARIPGTGFSLGNDYLFTTQFLYQREKEGFRWENVAQTELAETQPVGTAPDGRPIYADLQALGINNAIQLTNFSGGDSYIFTAALAKQYENGFGFDVSYAFQDIETTTPGTSSRGVSNFRGIFDSDRNNPQAATSPFETEHAFTINLSQEAQIFGQMMTRFDVFGQITSGAPFSYTFNVTSFDGRAFDPRPEGSAGGVAANGGQASNALFGRSGNGESPFDNDLLYVPTRSGGVFNDPNVVFASGFDQGAFLDFLNERDIGSGIIDRNSDESTWNQRWDFRLEQELPFINYATDRFGLNQFNGDRLTFIVDILNVANLLNDEWGTQFNGANFDSSQIVTADIVSAADVAAFGIDGAPALFGDDPRTTCVTQTDCVYRFNSFSQIPTSFQDLDSSVYQIRLGIRYEF